jgi:D-arabinose 1-dehydrogenase-like Zn-dependent alcohol dehydrogenase
MPSRQKPRAPSVRYLAYRHTEGVVSITAVEASLTQLNREHADLILIQPHYTGICSADIREVRGERPGRIDFGHEVVGSVLESTLPQFQPGDPVVMDPFVKVARETAFAQMMYLAGPADRLASALIKVPVDQVEFSLVEPLACAIHAARHSLLDQQEPRLVAGAGFFGYLLYCYLDYNGVSVTLTNRSPDRLAELLARIPGLRVIPTLEDYGGSFSTVFLMQTRMHHADITRLSRWVREDGEIILFASVDQREAPALYAARSFQQRVPWSENGKLLYIQGTLDADRSDLEKAVAMLSQPDFVAKLSPILAESLSFGQGAAHLTQRAVAPRSYQKHVVDVRS